jgi:hypothetical protein
VEATEAFFPFECPHYLGSLAVSKSEVGLAGKHRDATTIGKDGGDPGAWCCL